ncbi:glycosyl hydrolase [Pedobacter rhodius]|uniref:Glycosyl hydrolase n=1 Tax=Pedobacter rhodius TaxID=3004098 RepID=A0ABT4KYL9_9SPHI|nr:glycosyl hydrolase [Pedobacter sp. SJ11]MCZ4222958.1 glycosyl hydrolase [Pedobacter sp. SJ11]
MKRLLLSVAFFLCSLTLAAQAPNLPVKGTLSQTILSSRTFSNATQADTVIRYRPSLSEYTLELVGKVNSATGRGLDIDVRNSKARGYRLSLDAANLKTSAPLSAITAISTAKAGVDQTIRIAVRKDSAHIYQNGAYIQSQPLSTINDIVGGAESSVIQGTVAGPNLMSGWAGVTGNYSGKPSDYGWAYNGTTSTTLFNTANSTAGGSRYVDVSASASPHTYNGTTYNGRMFYVRWDASTLASVAYTYAVTLEANSTYNFSMLHAYLSNATGSKTLTVGIGKTTSASDRFASSNFVTSGTADLKRENFSFTSQEAGTYYLTFTGPWGLFSIAELSLNKNLASSLIPNWAGMAPNNAGSPAAYSWGYTGTTSTTVFNTANGSGGTRYVDINASSGSNLHTYNGATYTGRVLYIRWDGSSISGTAYNYPVMLEANTSYNLSMLHAYVSNATGSKNITVGIGKTTAVADRFSTYTFVTSGTRVLNKETFSFTSKEAGLYYLTITGDWALFSIADLSLNKYEVKPRFIFGKNYLSGAVDISVSSVTYDDGAYAPTAPAAAPKQDLIVTGSTASFLPTSNTNFIVPGKTDMHLTGAGSPLINSTVQLNSNDAWLFFDNIRPSLVIANWLPYVSINGVPAANNPDVRISIYKNGTVIIPNGNITSTQALQVYTGTNLSGTNKSYKISVYNDSLGAFNNAIKSFKLKRGYMATLANNADGSGYSRVFIANDDDLVVNTMPQGLDATVSFIRVFKWDYVSKKGKAGWSPAQVGATWYYDWNIGGAESTDYNYSIIRQNAGWPAWGDIKNKQNVNHLLGFNEPDQADQSNMTVAQAIQQWPEMMKSGLRIGSPSPANPESSWITNFLAKTDSLNLRVDVVAIHCYWGGQTPQQWYTRLKNIYNRVKRPLWITEWNNGANWTTESWPADTTQALQKQFNDIKGILNVLDTASFIERYAEYDWVQYKRSLVLADTLTPAGKYYYANKSALAYNPAMAAVHNWQLASPQIYSSINSNNYRTATLNWLDLNGELGSKYVLERLVNGVDADFIPIKEFTGYPYGSTITHVDSVFAKASYRIKAFNLAGTQSVYSPIHIISKDADPVAPTSLTGTVTSSKITQLTWNAGVNARGYNLKRALSATGPFTTIFGQTTALTYQDTTLTPSTNYYYVVTSLNSAGESPNSTVLQLTTKDLVTPAVVTNPHAASGDTKVVLTWDLMYDAKFEVSRSTTPNGTYAVIAANVDAIRYEDLNRINGTTYYYKIVAFNAAGRSAESAILSATPVSGQYLHIGFNENTGTFAEDDWGGYNGTVMNTSTWTAGKDGPTGALNLVKSASSYLKLPTGVVSTLNDFTIATWVKLPSNLSNNTRIFDFGTSTNNFMILIPKTGSNLRYKIAAATGANDRYMPYVLPLNQWVHIAITQQGSAFKLYVNGTLQYTDNNATIKPSDLGLTTNNYLGKSQYSTDPYSDHIYDDFRIYNRALSDTELADLLKISQTITFSPIDQKMVGAADFDPGATASSGLAISYNSSDTTAATIVNGKVHIKAAGSSVVTAAQSGNSSYAPATSVSQTLTITASGSMLASTKTTPDKYGVLAPDDTGIPVADKITVYPNPVIDKRFSVRLTKDLMNQTITVRIRDAYGKVLQTNTIKANADELNVSLAGNYMPGVYFVQLNSLRLIRVMVYP